MPYTEWMIKDRKAVGQLNYHLRRFQKQVDLMDLDQADRLEIAVKISELSCLVSSMVDFDDAGKRIA